MKLLFSFILQPAIAITFSVLIFSIYDYGFYGTCKYQALNVIMPNPINSTLKTFFIDANNQDDNCRKTIGWWMSDKFDFSAIENNTLTLADLIKAKAGLSGAVKQVATMAISGAVEVGIATASIALSLVEGLGDYVSGGNFIDVPTAPVRGFFQVIGSMLVACFAIYIGKEVSEQLADFAAEMTHGISVKELTSSPKQTFDTLMKMAKILGGAALGGAGASAGADMGLDAEQASDLLKRGNINSSSASDMIARNKENKTPSDNPNKAPSNSPDKTPSDGPDNDPSQAQNDDTSPSRNNNTKVVNDESE